MGVPPPPPRIMPKNEFHGTDDAPGTGKALFIRDSHQVQQVPAMFGFVTSLDSGIVRNANAYRTFFRYGFQMLLEYILRHDETKR